MATIIVEDGTGLTNSNSYVSDQDLENYAVDRGLTLTGRTDVLLIKAMDYIESLSFIGTRFTEEQALQWPRDEVYIDTYYIERETIPKELKNGLMATAVAIDQELDPLRTVDRATKREKVDVVEIEYMDSAASETIVRTINAAMRKIIRPGGFGGTSFAVVRA